MICVAFLPIVHRLDDAAERAVLGALAFILILTILRSNPVRGLIISILSIGLWAFISYTAFKHGYLVRGKLLFFVMIPVVYGYAVFYDYLVLRKSYRNIEEALGVDNSMGN